MDSRSAHHFLHPQGVETLGANKVSLALCQSFSPLIRLLVAERLPLCVGVGVLSAAPPEVGFRCPGARVTGGCEPT